MLFIAHSYMYLYGSGYLFVAQTHQKILLFDHTKSH